MSKISGVRSKMYSSAKVMGDVRTFQKATRPGSVKYNIYTQDLFQTISFAATPRLDLMAMRVQQAARDSMKWAPKPGVPSKAGTPPNRQTGNLAESIQYGFESPTVALVGPTPQAWYGKIQEYGKQETVAPFRRWPPRPFMQPALEKMLNEDFETLISNLALRRYATSSKMKPKGKSKIATARGGIYKTAKALGDIDALMSGKIAQRIGNRGLGKLTARGMSSVTSTMTAKTHGGAVASRFGYRATGYSAAAGIGRF